MTLQKIIKFAENMDERDINRIYDMLVAYQKEVIVNAVKALSYNELEGIRAIFADGQMEKIFSAKEIAQKNNLTRSILVSAIDKLVVAQLVQSKSLGCKGTYVKVVNEGLFEVLTRV